MKNTSNEEAGNAACICFYNWLVEFVGKYDDCFDRLGNGDARSYVVRKLMQNLFIQSEKKPQKIGIFEQHDGILNTLHHVV